MTPTLKFTFAAVALASLALSAAPASAQSIRVAVAGKSPVQLHAELTRAASAVCRSAVADETFPRQAYAACYKATLATAITKAADPAVAAMAGIKLAQR